MKLTLMTAALILFSILNSSFPSSSGSMACPPEARLLEVGEFHGEEVDAETGEPWLGLHISDKGSMLLDYQLNVESVYDPIVDDEGQQTGKKVTVDLPLEPTFLVNSDWVLQSGPVETVYEGDKEWLHRKSPLKLKLAGSEYEIKVTGDEGEKCWADGLPKNAKLILANGTSSQVLYTLEECGSDPSWYLHWAGDLDKDGKLDLYVTVTQHYNISERKLFLSSQADEGQLVQEAAQFVTSGC
jgi:hypothetical protein